ncbi:hypothetical protein B8V81_3107 [Paenibacillus pasadenensis]|uniref:Uncharacterized protein n=1 Tax=Paenibacillus pasadenensis TaxID=217090 RepID=A0A2N5N2X3_9BACL|nr:hypothetical protein B8V81_3107 [Paenibacillus pasadenensis]
MELALSPLLYPIAGARETPPAPAGGGQSGRPPKKPPHSCAGTGGAAKLKAPAAA